MLKFTMITMTILSSLMINIFNPLIFGFLMMIQSSLICLTSRILMKSSWMSLTIFMIIIGGLMVVFMYTTSICANIKFNYIKHNKMLFYIIVISPLWTMNPNMSYYKEQLMLMDIFNKEMIKLYLPMNLNTSLFMFFYLLLVLIIMIKMTTQEKGPMRKKY